MNYYELIYLKRALKNKFAGGYIEQAITPFKNFLEIFVINSESRYRLLYSVTPGNTALFTDSYRGAKKTNTIDFFTGLYGTEITDITIPESDRWLYLNFKDGNRLCFRIFSNKANVFQAQNGIISEAFKDFDEEGATVPEPKKLDLFHADISGKSTKNKLLALNPMFPRESIEELIHLNELDKKTDEEIRSFAVEADRQLREAPEFRLLENGDTTMFSEKLLPVSTKKKFKDVNELISYRYKNHSHDQRLKQQKSELLNQVTSKVKKLQSLLTNLEKRKNSLEKADKYEQWGHLLMANAHLQKVDKKEIEVENVFEEGQKEVINLQKEDADIAENAQYYYKKAQNARHSYEEAKKELPQVKKDLEYYSKLKDEIEGITDLWKYQDWEKEHKSLVNEITKGSAKKDEQELPFHTLQIHDYTVWIGKNAKSNDKLVQSAHKEDVWMHARGVPGSHLVIRMGNDKNMPTKEVLLKAASYAAYNSKAKGSDLVPVIITKMKYVRKPKGAAPGAVLVDKEEVEMVSPEKPI